MSTIDDGGPAFPDPGRAQSAKQRQVLTHQGMSLRDYFAAMAMQGMLADDAAPEESIAKWAYRQADAMLKERNAK